MRKATLYPLKLVNCIKVLLVRHEGLLNWMKCEYFGLRDVCHSLIYIQVYHYRPPTKLWEGSVFTGVCHSVHGGPHVTIIHDALDLTVQAPLSNRPETQSPVPPPLTPGGQH